MTSSEAMKLISDTVGDVYEYNEPEHDMDRITTLGYIRGICDAWKASQTYVTCYGDELASKIIEYGKETQV